MGFKGLIVVLLGTLSISTVHAFGNNLTAPETEALASDGPLALDELKAGAVEGPQDRLD